MPEQQTADKQQTRTADERLQILKSTFPGWMEVETGLYPKIFETEADRLLDECRRLRDELNFRYLSTISGVDRQDSFEVVYFIYNLEQRWQLGLKVRLDHDLPEVDSVTEIWPAANWMERETYDLLGIRFRNHPDLRRIYLNHSFQGYPLRKDFIDLRPKRNRRIRSR